MKRRGPKSLKAEMAAAEGLESPRAPGGAIKFLLGLLLLPGVIILFQTFFSALSRETVERAFWRTPEFLCFVAAADLWIMLFILRPNFARKFLSIYVFGHELTHAVWTWLLGGRIKAFRASRTGGYVVTNRDDVLVVLAPYFYPFYSMIVVLEYGIFNCWFDMRPWHPLFFAALGLTWAFHITFTFWMIFIGQPDIVYHGWFFSIVFVAFMNLLVLSALLCIAAPGVSVLSYLRELVENGTGWYRWGYGLLSGAVG